MPGSILESVSACCPWCGFLENKKEKKKQKWKVSKSKNLKNHQLSLWVIFTSLFYNSLSCFCLMTSFDASSNRRKSFSHTHCIHSAMLGQPREINLGTNAFCLLQYELMHKNNSGLTNKNPNFLRKIHANNSNNNHNTGKKKQLWQNILAVLALQELYLLCG